MNTTTHRSPPEATGAYRPADGTDARPAAELVAGSAPLGDHELVPLLHKRLWFLVLVFTVYYTAVVIVRIVHSGRLNSAIDDWATPITVVILLGLLALLSIRCRMTLRQLRVVEFVLFAILAARVVLRGYVQFWQQDYIDRVHAWIATGDVENAREMLFGLAHRLMLVS